MVKKRGQKIRAWVDPPPIIRAMPERKRFFSTDVFPKRTPCSRRQQFDGDADYDGGDHGDDGNKGLKNISKPTFPPKNICSINARLQTLQRLNIDDSIFISHSIEQVHNW